MAEQLVELHATAGRLLEKMRAFRSRADTLLQNGIHARLSTGLVKGFPHHPSTLDVVRGDRALESSLREHTSEMRGKLEPWYEMIEDLVAFHKLTLRALKEVAARAPVVSMKRNGALVTLFMKLFVAAVRVYLLSASLPRELLLQVYVLYYSLSSPDSEPSSYASAVKYVVDSKNVFPSLQRDFEPISQRIGVILDGVVEPALSYINKNALYTSDILKLGSGEYEESDDGYDVLKEQFFSERAALDMHRFADYQIWGLVGIIVCPSELHRPQIVELLKMVLRDALLFTVDRDVGIWMHDQFMLQVQPKLDAIVKSDTNLQKALGLTTAKGFIADCYEYACANAATLHQKNRQLCIGHLDRIIHSIKGNPAHLSSRLSIACAVLSFSRDEILWYFRHFDQQPPKGLEAGLPLRQISQKPFQSPDVGLLLGMIFSLVDVLREYSAVTREAIRTFLSSECSNLRPIVAMVFGAPELSPMARGLLRQSWNGFAAYTGMIEEGTAESLGILKALEMDWLRYGIEISSASGRAGAHDIDDRIKASPKAIGLTKAIGFLEYFPHLIENRMPLLSLRRVVDELSSLEYLLDVPLSSFKQLEDMYFGAPSRIAKQCAVPLRIYEAMEMVAETSSSHQDDRISEELLVNAKEYSNKLIAYVENLLGMQYNEGLPSLERQLTAEQAVQRMVSAGPNVNRRRRQSVAVRQNASGDIAGGVNTKPLPGFESRPINFDSLKKMVNVRDVLLSVCEAIAYTDSLTIKGETIQLRDMLLSKLESVIRDHIQAAVNGGDEVRKPSELALELQHIRAMFRCIEEVVDLDISFLFSKVLSGTVSDDDDNGKATRNTIAAVYADWYVQAVIQDTFKINVVYNAPLCTFENMRSAKLRIADFMNPIELRHLISIFGEALVVEFDWRLRAEAAKALQTLDEVARENAYACNEILAIGQQNVEKLKPMLHDLTRLQEAQSAAQTIGTITIFRRLVGEATRDIYAKNLPSIPPLLDNVSALLRATPGTTTKGTGFLEVCASLESSGADSKSEGYTDVALVQVFNKANKTWDHLPLVLALSLISVRWPQATYNVQKEAFGENIHCMLLAVAPLISASQISLVAMREKRMPTATDAPSLQKLDKLITERCENGLNLFIRYASMLIREFQLPFSIFLALEKIVKLQNAYAKSEVPFPLLRSAIASVLAER